MTENIEQSGNGKLSEDLLPPDVVKRINKLHPKQRQLLFSTDRKLRANGKDGLSGFNAAEWHHILNQVETRIMSRWHIRRDADFDRWITKLDAAQCLQVKDYLNSISCPPDWTVKRLRQVLNIGAR